MACPPRSVASNEASAPESLPMGVRADETMTEPGMGTPREEWRIDARDWYRRRP